MGTNLTFLMSLAGNKNPLPTLPKSLIYAHRQSIWDVFEKVKILEAK